MHALYGGARTGALWNSEVHGLGVASARANFVKGNISTLVLNIFKIFKVLSKSIYHYAFKNTALLLLLNVKGPKNVFLFLEPK